MALLDHTKGAAKAGGAAVFGLLTGAVMMYSRAAVERVTKSQPLANFSVAEKDGLKVTFHNQAVGDSGYWDFGDGSELVPFTVDAPVVHTYPKAGSFTAKLTVRNFLMEEKDRSVTVDLDAPATPAPNLLPKVTLSVKPVGQSVAPATFRVSGKLENVERAFLDYGDKVEVQTEAGEFEKYVVIEKPGTSPIQLIGHSGKQAVKESARVDVQGGKAGGLTVMVRTVDGGTRTHKETWQEMVAVPAVKGQKVFEKVIQARPGHTLSAATVGTAPKGVKGLTATVAPDKRSVKVTGEWADANAAEAMVPLTMAGERAVAVSFPQTAAAAFDAAQTQALVQLPPHQRDMAGLTRKIAVELRLTDESGRPQVVTGTPDLKGKWEQPLKDGRVIRAEQVGEQVRVTIGR